MDIFVISLKKAIKRRESVIKQMDALGIRFVFFDAVNGADEDHYLFQRYDDKLRRKIKGNSLRSGELGCFSSHYLIWEKCIEIGRPIIVLEDDIVLKNNFLVFIKNINNFIDYGYLRLFVSSRKRKFKNVRSACGFEVLRYLRGPAATRGYMITPESSRQLIKGAKKWSLPVDDYMDQFWSHGVVCRGISPGIIEGDGAGFESTISSSPSISEASKKNLSMRIAREMNHATELIKRIVFNLKFKD